MIERAEQMEGTRDRPAHTCLRRANDDAVTDQRNELLPGRWSSRLGKDGFGMGGISNWCGMPLMGCLHARKALSHYQRLFFGFAAAEVWRPGFPWALLVSCDFDRGACDFNGA